MADRTPKIRPNLEMIEIINRLEAITGSATKLPLTKRAVINPREIQELVTQLRNSLPNDINEALQIIRYRDSLLQQAQTDATHVRNKAEQEALLKLSDSQIVKDAKKMAEGIIAEAREQQQAMLAEAEKQAQARVEGADTYAIDVLGRLEEELSALLQTTRRGVETLKEGKDLEKSEG